MSTTSKPDTAISLVVASGNVPQGTRMKDAQALVSAMLGPLLGNLLKLEQKWKQEQTELLSTMGKSEANAAHSTIERGALESAAGFGGAMALGGAALGAASAAGTSAAESASYISDLKGFQSESEEIDGRAEIAENPEKYAASLKDDEYENMELSDEEESKCSTPAEKEAKLTEKKAAKARKLYERDAEKRETEKAQVERDRKKLRHKEGLRETEHTKITRSADVTAQYGNFASQVGPQIMNMIYKPLEAEQEATSTNQRATGQVAQSGSQSADATHSGAVQLAQEASRAASESSASTARAAG